MKKLFVLILALAMSLSLAACGGDKAASSASVSSEAPPASSEAPVASEAPAASESSEAAPAEQEAGDATAMKAVTAYGLSFNLPGDFSEPMEKDGLIAFGGAQGSVTVMPSAPADLKFDEWNEEVAFAYFGQSYKNSESMGFNNGIKIGDAPAFMEIFTGDNANGESRQITVLVIYPDESTQQAIIFLTPKDSQDFFATNLSAIIDSVKFAE